MIYFTSDLHLCHNKEFMYTPRGFTNIQDHNNAIVENWNKVVTPDDEVWVLGDLVMTDAEEGLKYLKQLNGKIHVIIGNHDSFTKLGFYKTLENVSIEGYAYVIKYQNYKFYLSHFPTLIDGNIEKKLKNQYFGLHGHTHSKEKFFEYNPFMYNVACDAHNCTPVSIDQIIMDIEERVREIRETIAAQKETE